MSYYKIIFILIVVIGNCKSKTSGINMNIMTSTSLEICKSPEECFRQSYAILSDDRKMIRDLDSNLMRLISDNIDSVKIELDHDITNYDSKVDKIINFSSEIDKKLTELSNKQLEVKKEISTIKEKFHEYSEFEKFKNYMYNEAIIYDDIISSFDSGVIKKNGNPVGWDDKSYRSNNLWFTKTLLKIGNGEQSGGLETTIPENYNVLWIRIHNHPGEPWGNFKITYLDGNKESIGTYSCDNRNLNEISPDGATADSFSEYHMWHPIAVPRSGTILIESRVNHNTWFSGIAFGKNLWNRAMTTAAGIFWNAKGGSNGIGWVSDKSNNDNLGKINPGLIATMNVPVMNSKKDKILYIIEQNTSIGMTAHKKIKVNGVEVLRLRSSFSNPFATHFNSKIADRYIATVVSKIIVDIGEIENNKYMLRVEIDMTDQNDGIYFREIGTHDII